ncbi:MAG: HYExAFE family protein [Sedimentisphaerales bacterium]|nr:HYExAFE family protein [Sedimentisphaerales bacterium]
MAVISMSHTPNHFETAFENWLIENRIQYVQVDQRKRAVFVRNKIKSFDFLLYPAGLDKDTLIVEVKGRTFSGKSLARLGGLQCWVTMEDVRGLLRWEEVFGKDHAGMFVFVYELANVDIDADGQSVFECDGKRYFFKGLKLSDYSNCMRLRSQRWQTVMIGADDFRRHAVDLETVLF